MKYITLIFLMATTLAQSVNAADYGACKKILVTGNAEYPPLTWQDRQHPDKLTGFAIEILEIVFRDLDLPVEARYVGPWARAQAEVRQGNIDMLGGAYITEERQTFMDYVMPPFVMDPTVIFIKKGKAIRFEKWADLIGLTGGSPIGNSYGDKFDRFAKEKLTIDLVREVSQAFKKLVIDRNDYVVYGLYPGLAVAEENGLRNQLEYLPNSVISEGLYFTFGKKSPCNQQVLKDHLAKRVQELSEQKIPEQLLEKYLDIWKAQSAAP